MREYRETIEDVKPEVVQSRFSPTLMPSTVIRREEFDAAGNFVRVVSRKRIYWNGDTADITNEKVS